jgi:hypothetical protein
VSADEHLAELDKVAVLLVVDLDDTPGVRTATDGAAVGGLDAVVGTDDSERDLALEVSDSTTLIPTIISLFSCCVSSSSRSYDGGWKMLMLWWAMSLRTRSLKTATSSSVRVSALAITGMRLTLVWRRFMNSMSMGLSLRVSANMLR